VDEGQDSLNAAYRLNNKSTFSTALPLYSGTSPMSLICQLLAFSYVTSPQGTMMLRSDLFHPHGKQYVHSRGEFSCANACGMKTCCATLAVARIENISKEKCPSSCSRANTQLNQISHACSDSPQASPSAMVVANNSQRTILFLICIVIVQAVVTRSSVSGSWEDCVVTWENNALSQKRYARVRRPLSQILTVQLSIYVGDRNSDHQTATHECYDGDSDCLYVQSGSHRRTRASNNAKDAMYL
jgi:hypothetical protein